MKSVAIFGAACALFMFSASEMTNAEGGRYDFEFNAPAFSFGFNTPKSKGSSSDLAPLDDDFADPPQSAPLQDEPPLPYTENRDHQYIEPGERQERSYKDGGKDFGGYNDRNDQFLDRDNLDEPDRPFGRLAMGCLSDKTVSRNLRAGGWHNFRNYRTTRRRVKVTADNPVGRPFRLTIHRCTGAILFARML